MDSARGHRPATDARSHPSRDGNRTAHRGRLDPAIRATSRSGGEHAAPEKQQRCDCRFPALMLYRQLGHSIPPGPQCAATRSLLSGGWRRPFWWQWPPRRGGVRPSMTPDPLARVRLPLLHRFSAGQSAPAQLPTRPRAPRIPRTMSSHCSGGTSRCRTAACSRRRRMSA